MEWNDIKTNFWIGLTSFVLGFLLCGIIVISAQTGAPQVNDIEDCTRSTNVTTIYIINESRNQTYNFSTGATIVCIPLNPPEPVGYITIRTDTPVSEPYFISKTPPTFEVGDWVRTNAEYKRCLKREFQGQIVEVGEDGVMLVRTDENETRYVDETWLEHWICEMVIYDSEIGYYCYTKLLDKTYKFNENSTVVSVIFEDTKPMEKQLWTK